MKFQPDRSSAQTVRAQGPGWIAVEAERIQQSVILSAEGLRRLWDCPQFESLTAQHLAELAELDAEVLILGTGNRTRFPPAAWQQPFMAKRLGLECMDTAAACRTYNVLANEGRKVAGAFILETERS